MRQRGALGGQAVIMEEGNRGELLVRKWGIYRGRSDWCRRVLPCPISGTLPARNFAARQSPSSSNRNDGWQQTDSKCPL